jgi:hypothetical protein
LIRRKSEENMKVPKKISIGLTLALAILTITISLANAQPQPIGTSLQKNPWDSNPSAFTVSDNSGMGGDTTVNSFASMCDGRLTTMGYFTLCEWDYAGYVEIHTFDNPTTLFTIGWVDIKMKYQVDPYAFDDTYEIEYSTDGVTWNVLQSSTTSQFDVDSGVAQVRSWAEVPEPNDGTWSWNDVSNLKVRVSFDPGADGFCDFNTMYIYELWASVYEGPLPPSSSSAMSIQPPVVETLAAGRRLFVEVYAQDVTNLVAYQLTINFNTTVLTPMAGGWSYYPFTDKATEDLNDAGGLAYSTPIGDPIATTGVTGNLTLARIYFRVDVGMTASDYSFLTFSVSLLSDPAATRIVHGEYHGLYGTPPPGIALMGWIPASEFPWGTPITTEWVELWPNEGQIWHLTSHEENQVEPLPDGELNPSDQVDMLMVEPPGDDVWWWHVEDVWESFVDQPAPDPAFNVYMILKFKYVEPVPEFPLGLGLIMLLAPMIPLAYLWRLRKKVRKQ